MQIYNKKIGETNIPQFLSKLLIIHHPHHPIHHYIRMN
jgi:hypothetical protein